MTTQVWALIAFASWTLFGVLTTVGIYRWSNNLAGRIPIKDFHTDPTEGADLSGSKREREDSVNAGYLPTLYFAFGASTAFALGGGSHAGEMASNADTEFSFVLLSALIFIAIIGRLRK